MSSDTVVKFEFYAGIAVKMRSKFEINANTTIGKSETTCRVNVKKEK